MADWVTNKLEAPKDVLKSLLTADGTIDFNLISSFKGSYEWTEILGEAERCAKAVMAIPINGRPSRTSDIYAFDGGSVARELNDESFEQFIQMLRNLRNHGYANHKDFAYGAWGTILSASDQKVDLEAGFVTFQTAGSTPQPLLKALSAKHPNDMIKVSSARHYQEDEGACGIFVYKGGQVVSSDIPDWYNLSALERSKWIAFARELTGISESE